MSDCTADMAFDNPRRALPRIALVFAIHALALFALVSVDRIEHPRTTQTAMLVTTIAPKLDHPPPPPPPPTLRRQKSRSGPPPRESAAPALRDIEVVPSTGLLATIVDTEVPVINASGGRPEGTGTEGAGNVGTGGGGAGGAGAPVKVPAKLDPANCERPTLPKFAEELGLTGHVILAVQIGVDGKVTDARLARSSGSPILDQTALAAARHCHFVAATIDNVPIPSWEAFRFSWTGH